MLAETVFFFDVTGDYLHSVDHGKPKSLYIQLYTSHTLLNINPGRQTDLPTINVKTDVHLEHLGVGVRHKLLHWKYQSHEKQLNYRSQIQSHFSQTNYNSNLLETFCVQFHTKILIRNFNF